MSSAVTNVMCVLLVEMRLIGKQTSFSGPTLFTAFPGLSPPLTTCAEGVLVLGEDRIGSAGFVLPA